MFRLPYVRSREPPPSQFLAPAALLPRSPMPIRPAIEVPPTGHDGDALAGPGVRVRDGGVSHALLLSEVFLGVVVAGRSSEEARVGADEDGADGFDSFEGDVDCCLHGDWLDSQKRKKRQRNRDGTHEGWVTRKLERSQRVENAR